MSAPFYYSGSSGPSFLAEAAGAQPRLRTLTGSAISHLFPLLRPSAAVYARYRTPGTSVRAAGQDYNQAPHPHGRASFALWPGCVLSMRMRSPQEA
ncbi:MAG: hypothetical protein COW29_04620 [Rhodobacterales bacterium CG15_BIG_FIL_POST_REV_8_21_14_020_59_13]|nr:MAG: hypothetical protein COW29_04620 [Rhodobacterales bacterium CG15_BIG_FIL_POST_REV_8_21_14_020_59_13]